MNPHVNYLTDALDFTAVASLPQLRDRAHELTAGAISLRMELSCLIDTLDLVGSRRERDRRTEVRLDDANRAFLAVIEAAPYLEEALQILDELVDTEMFGEERKGTEEEEEKLASPDEPESPRGEEDVEEAAVIGALLASILGAAVQSRRQKLVEGEPDACTCPACRGEASSGR